MLVSGPHPGPTGNTIVVESSGTGTVPDIPGQLYPILDLKAHAVC